MAVPIISTVGTSKASGDPAEGGLYHYRGGSRTATVWSGNILTGAAFTPGAPGAVASGGHVLLWSGAGRLNSVLQHNQMVSGLPVYFYDAGTITVSGTSVSGQRIVGVLPPTFAGGGVSGNSPAVFTGAPLNVDFPFTSGLCAAVPSGTPGFSCSFTPG